jgi:hypothetical protein
MPRDTKKIIGQLAGRLPHGPLEEYLASEKFLRLCRDHEVEDAWKEYLELSRDRPDLYGGSVMQNAFVLFLHHIFHEQPDAFPLLFTRFLAGFSRGISQPLPLDDLEKDLAGLGYPEKVLEKKFSALKAKEKKHLKDRCPD